MNQETKIAKLTGTISVELTRQQLEDYAISQLQEVSAKTLKTFKDPARELWLKATLVSTGKEDGQLDFRSFVLVLPADLLVRFTDFPVTISNDTQLSELAASISPTCGGRSSLPPPGSSDRVEAILSSPGILSFLEQKIQEHADYKASQELDEVHCALRLLRAKGYTIFPG